MSAVIERSDVIQNCEVADCKTDTMSWEMLKAKTKNSGIYVVFHCFPLWVQACTEWFSLKGAEVPAPGVGQCYPEWTSVLGSSAEKIN